MVKRALSVHHCCTCCCCGSAITIIFCQASTASAELLVAHPAPAKPPAGAPQADKSICPAPKFEPRKVPPPTSKPPARAGAGAPCCIWICICWPCCASHAASSAGWLTIGRGCVGQLCGGAITAPPAWSPAKLPMFPPPSVPYGDVLAPRLWSELPTAGTGWPLWRNSCAPCAFWQSFPNLQVPAVKKVQIVVL